MSKKILSTIIVLTMIFTLLSGAISVNRVKAASTWYVDGALGIDDNTHGTGPGANAFKTIQYAINDSRVIAGDTINVAAGTYVEQVLIDGKDLTLTGAGIGVTTICPKNWNGSASYTGDYGIGSVDVRPVIMVRNGATVNISNLTVSGRGWEEEFVSLWGTPYVYNPTPAGIFYHNSSGRISYVEAMHFGQDCATSGGHHTVGLVGFCIISRTRLTATKATSIEVDHCYLHDFDWIGMFMSRQSGTTVNAIANIHNNEIKGSNGAAVSGQVGIEFSNVAGNIDDNNMYDCDVQTGTDSSNMLLVWDSPDVKVRRNHIWQTEPKDTGNLMAACFWWDTGWSGNLLLEDNIIEGHPHGMELYLTTGTTFTATGNKIIGNGTGVYVDSTCASSPTFSCNDIFDNSFFAIDNKSSVIVNAKYNWWGDVSGPTHGGNPGGTGDAISGNIDYTPWLPMEFQNCPECGGALPVIGGKAYPVNKFAVLLPWLTLLAAIVAVVIIIWKHYRTQS